VSLRPLLERVRLVVFDFDGVFTDNRVWVGENGEEFVSCLRSDGFGLRRLDEVGVEYVILSTEQHGAVQARARKLRAACRTGLADKLEALHEEARARGVPLEEVSYVGNDINDSTCLDAVGLPVVPADAWAEVVPLARLVLERRGGEGCVRELCDAIWAAKRAAS